MIDITTLLFVISAGAQELSGETSLLFHFVTLSTLPHLLTRPRRVIWPPWSFSASVLPLSGAWRGALHGGGHPPAVALPCAAAVKGPCAFSRRGVPPAVRHVREGAAPEAHDRGGAGALLGPRPHPELLVPVAAPALRGQ